MPPTIRPTSTAGCEMSNETTADADLAASSRSSSWNAANNTSAASTADPMAYPFVTALVVLPTASKGSVTFRTSSGRFAISAMPPALSVIGPNASSATISPVRDSCAITATPMP